MPIVLYDGGCALCARAVRFIVPRDARGRFQFRSLQDPDTRAWLARHGPGELPDSLIFIGEGRLLFRGDAALAICRELRAPWPWLGHLFALLPRAARDALYDAVARRRLRWFGSADATCPLFETLPPERIWQPEAESPEGPRG